MCTQSSPFAFLIWNWVEGGVDLYRYLPQLYLIGDKVITDFFSPMWMESTRSHLFVNMPQVLYLPDPEYFLGGEDTKVLN